MFGYFAKLTAHAGRGEELVANLILAAKLMEAVPGCLLYVVNRAADDADTVWVTEIWKDEKAHAASLSVTGVRELIAKSVPLLASKPEGTRVTPIAGKGLAALSAAAQAVK